MPTMPAGSGSLRLATLSIRFPMSIGEAMPPTAVGSPGIGWPPGFGGRTSFSDAPDTTQREGVIARNHAKDIPMLMLFRQNGEEAKGWRGTPFYWPVIWAPENARTAVYSHTTQ